MNAGPGAKPSAAARLLAIVEVDSSERVRCAQPGCQKSVYRAIHIVRDGGELLVLGSTCFQKRFGGLLALGQAQYGGGGGKLLGPEERQMLQENTEALLARFEAQEEQARQAAALRLARLREAQQSALERSRALAPAPSIAPAPVAPWAHAGGRPLPTRPRFPWAWMKPRTGVAAYKLRDGTGWVRVEHLDGRQFITPWPSFEGWDEALPPVVGRADRVVGGYEVQGAIFGAIEYLRSQLQGGPMSDIRTGMWADVLAYLGGRR